jgi:hypothetical protein
MALLERLVDQDIEVREDGDAKLKQVVARDRIVSVHAPEMRHGRKSKKVRFDGHKGELVVDADSGVILDAGVKAGNAHDAHGSLEAIERAEETLKAAWEDAPVEEGPEPRPKAKRGSSRPWATAPTGPRTTGGPLRRPDANSPPSSPRSTTAGATPKRTSPGTKTPAHAPAPPAIASCPRGAPAPGAGKR